MYVHFFFHNIQYNQIARTSWWIFFKQYIYNATQADDILQGIASTRVYEENH